MRTSFASMVFCALLAACGGSKVRGAAAPTAGQEDTTLGAGDVFEVRVYDEKELSGKHRIAHDGTIDFPFVGRIKVEGLEPTQVADLIAQRLSQAKYLNNPQISILVEQYNSKRITVLGAVGRPGTFPMTNGLTVVQAISLAGGFTSIASENQTVVTRRIGGKVRRFHVSAQKVMEGMVDDFSLQAGDSVYVPERLF